MAYALFIYLPIVLTLPFWFPVAVVVLAAVILALFAWWVWTMIQRL